MFLKLGGTFTHFCTEKLSPCAWPAPWYGSCPKITTFKLSKLLYLKALKISISAGNIFFPSHFSASKNHSMRGKYSELNSLSRIFCQDLSYIFFIFHFLIIFYIIQQLEIKPNLIKYRTVVKYVSKAKNKD